MKQKCANCAELLPWFPSGKWVCKKCGTQYVAKRKSKFSFAFGLYGALVMLYLPFLVFVPIPMWVKLYVVPTTYALYGVVLWRNQKTWDQKGAEAINPRP